MSCDAEQRTWLDAAQWATGEAHLHAFVHVNESAASVVRANWQRMAPHLSARGGRRALDQVPPALVSK